MKTKRMVEWCEEALSDGDLTTEEILEKVNERSKHGTTSHGLGNILAKDERFVRVGEDIIYRGAIKQRMAIWGLKRRHEKGDYAIGKL